MWSWVAAFAPLVVVALRVVPIWAHLPAVMASHFGPNGLPNGWMPRDAFFALTLGIAVVVTLPMMFSHRLVFAVPRLVNLPNRDHWLVPERRAEAAAKLRRWMHTFAILINLLFAVVVELVIRANLARAPIHNGALWATLGVFFVAMIALTVVLYRDFRVER